MSVLLFSALMLAACAPAGAPNIPVSGSPRVLAVETFLADIAQNVAGERLKVEALAPYGVDPHEFEPAPQDMVRLADSQVVIVNGGGVEGWLQKAVETVGGQRLVIVASDGLAGRTPREGEAVELGGAAQGGGVDPHFWLDPLSVVRYVENIRDGLSRADPGGKQSYANNADAYIARLKELDGWIRQQVAQVPAQRRMLVTNHESLGYFADRYGFRIVGTVIPSTSSEASPSAQQLARLINVIQATHAPAIFLETGANPQMASQVAQETGVKVVTDLYTHSVTPAGGGAPTYLDMMKYDTLAIVNALK